MDEPLLNFEGVVLSPQKEVFGVAPSGRHVWWIGMPIFTFEGSKVRDLYVLGDIHGLVERMRSE
jgi:hypothetical protein